MSYSQQQARHNLISAIRHTQEALALRGVIAIKRRDKREPGRREKEDAEERITRIVKRAFRKQKEQVQRWMETTYFERAEKRLPEFPDIDFDEDEYNDLIEEFLKAAKNGVNLFGTGQAIIDYTLTNKEAARWAREYVFDLVKGINSTTRDVLRDAVGAFVDTPGMTIGDVMRQLPFDEERAQRVAVTEITRAYAEGEMIAGRELQKEFPGVRIVKIWFTNNDDRVCDICGPLDGVEIELSEKWDGDLDQPPAHVNCRCWMETTTALGEILTTAKEIVDTFPPTVYHGTRTSIVEKIKAEGLRTRGKQGSFDRPPSVYFTDSKATAEWYGDLVSGFYHKQDYAVIEISTENIDKSRLVIDKMHRVRNGEIAWRYEGDIRPEDIINVYIKPRSEKSISTNTDRDSNNFTVIIIDPSD